MTAQAASSITSAPLLQARNNLILHQALYAAAKLGVADLLNGGVCTTAELAGELKVNVEALYRMLRALASQGIFEETTPRPFGNSQLSLSFMPISVALARARVRILYKFSPTDR